MRLVKSNRIVFIFVFRILFSHRILSRLYIHTYTRYQIFFTLLLLRISPPYEWFSYMASYNTANSFTYPNKCGLQCILNTTKTHNRGIIVVVVLVSYMIFLLFPFLPRNKTIGNHRRYFCGFFSSSMLWQKVKCFHKIIQQNRNGKPTPSEQYKE